MEEVQVKRQKQRNNLPLPPSFPPSLFLFFLPFPQAVNHGQPLVGIKAKDGVVLVGRKMLESKKLQVRPPSLPLSLPPSFFSSLFLFVFGRGDCALISLLSLLPHSVGWPSASEALPRGPTRAGGRNGHDS